MFSTGRSENRKVRVIRIIKMARLVSNMLLVLSMLVSIFGAKISSKIDLDDDPEERSTPPSTLSSSVLKAFVELNRGAGPGPESEKMDLEESSQQGTFGQSRLEQSEHDFINIDELFWDKKRQDGVRPVDIGHDASTIPPTIINNIHVTINGNDTDLGTRICKNGVCDVSVSTNPDGEGNLVTDVHLSVVTKVNKVLKVEDVPVIDGLRDIESDRTSDFDEFPTFHFENRQHVPFNVHFFDNNIPQVPIHRQAPEDFGSWYQVPKIFLRPRASWAYARNLEHGRKGQRGRRTWTSSKSIVDDKVEAPFSKTKTSY